MYDLNLIKRCNLPIMMSAIMMRDGRLCFMLIQATIRHKGSTVSSIAKALGTEYIMADRGSDSRVEILRNPRRTS
jgi:hypothetical protein